MSYINKIGENIEISFGEERGDCTRLYSITLKNSITVGQFISQILNYYHREFGQFEIILGGKEKDNPRCDYTYGEITSKQFSDDLLNLPIRRVSGYGNYGFSHYDIFV